MTDDLTPEERAAFSEMEPTLEEIREWQAEDEAWAAERMGLLDEPIGEGEPDPHDEVIADDFRDYYRGLL